MAVVGVRDFANMQLLGPSDTGTDTYVIDDIYAVEREENAGRAVPVDEYLLAVTMSTVVAEQPRRTDRSALGWLIGSAHALSCPPPSTTVSQRVSDIDLVSDADLSDDFPAGTSLKAIAKLHLGFSDFPDETLYGQGGRDFASVSTDAELLPLKAFVADGPTAPLIFDLLLDVPVDGPREHRFTLTYTLDDGDVFTETSDPVTLSSAD